MLNDATKFYQQGNLKAAIEECLQILEREPENIDALHLLGIINAAQHDYSAAKEFLEQALKFTPDSAAINNSLGNVWKKLGNLDKAKYFYEEALRCDPNYEIAFNNLGNLYLQSDNLEAAQKNYEQAIAINPKYIEPHYNLALLHKSLQNFAKAIDYLDKVLALQPNHLGAYFQKANSLQQLGKFKEAIEYYEKYLQYDEKNSEALQNIASCYLLQGSHQNALKYYLRALLFYPDAEIYYNIGVLYMDQDKHYEAIHYLESALSKDPHHFNSHNNLGAIYLKLGDYENALKHYTTALKIDPENKEIPFIISALCPDKITPPEAATEEYVTSLFDQYAKYFDAHLTGILDYKVPRLLFMAVSEIANARNLENLDVLDLGCGTGLVGKYFRALANQLVGIDLSSKMLAVAESKKIYDELQQAEILQKLNEFIASQKHFDLVLAGDVLVYFGALDELFAKVANILKNCSRRSLACATDKNIESFQLPRESNLFAFTIEKTDIYPYELQKTARFAHSVKYIEELAARNNFNLLTKQNVILRRHQNRFIEGYLFIFQI